MVNDGYWRRDREANYHIASAWRWLPLVGLVAISSSLAVPARAQLQTTIQLPTFGVAVDADGVLDVKTFVEPQGRLQAARQAAARKALAADIQADAALRKVSLVRLQRVVRRHVAAEQPLPEDVRYLAGLQRLQYVFCFPDQGDIVVAGPAGG